MKKMLLAVAGIFTAQLLFAQEVQWAFKVLEFSSQAEDKAYAAKQAIGKPNVFPATGQSVNAWQCKSEKLAEEFIKVGFFEPIKPKMVYIGESYNPGFISKVFLYDASGKEHEIASYTPKEIPEKGRILHIKTDNIDFFVFALKVVLSPIKGTPVGIDAIGISESTNIYEVKLNHADVIKANMVVQKLPRTVNSKYPEHGPLLAPDGKTLYFSRSFDPKNIGGADDYEDIWFSYWDDKNQNWGQSRNTGLPFNNDEPNYINSISPDGHTMLLGNAYSKKGSIVAGGASISYKTAKGWTTPKTVKIEDDHNINEKSNYYMSNSQKALLQSIQRKKEGYGDRDIYVSFVKPDSSWTKPINLGPIVNTVGTECAPFLASDEKTLYYASDGHGGYGGTDIYVTRRLDETWQKWSEPENLGPIVNTANNESYFTLSGSGDKVFYTSVGDSVGDVDIYTLALPEIIKPLPVVMVKGRVLDSKTNLPLSGVKIIFEDLVTGKEMGVAKSNPDNSEYEIMLPSGNDYGFLAVKAGYISVNANMDLRNLKEYEEMRKDLLLTPIEVGQTLSLNNVFFPSAGTVLMKESHQELNRLITLLKTNKDMKVEISGHTDNIGSSAYNDFISFQRAKAVSAYLMLNTDIKPERINVLYHGEGKPIADNSTPHGRKLNRRVEFKIVSD